MCTPYTRDGKTLCRAKPKSLAMPLTELLKPEFDRALKAKKSSRARLTSDDLMRIVTDPMFSVHLERKPSSKSEVLRLKKVPSETDLDVVECQGEETEQAKENEGEAWIDPWLLGSQSPEGNSTGALRGAERKEEASPSETASSEESSSESFSPITEPLHEGVDIEKFLRTWRERGYQFPGDVTRKEQKGQKAVGSNRKKPKGWNDFISNR